MILYFAKVHTGHGLFSQSHPITWNYSSHNNKPPMDPGNLEQSALVKTITSRSDKTNAKKGTK